MTDKKERNITKTTTRKMLGLRHYNFKQNLKYKSNSRGVNLIICGEEYTSKCCGNCGKINTELGGNKIFECQKCGLRVNRDIHAARNILIKALSQSVLWSDATIINS
jgi:putative transposase